MTRIPQGPTSGQDTATPATKLTVPAEVVAEADRDLDALDDLLGPPTERRSRALSRLAVRSDGVALISLEDAAALNLEGREVVSMMVLSDDERAFVLDSAQEFLDDRASRVLGKLPRRST